MADQTLQKLYKRLGPPLFARAKRLLTDVEAEEAVKEVVIALSKEKGLDDEELLKKGRALLAQRIKDTGNAASLDSVLPGLTPRKK
jgi:hypothetical protein